MTTIAQPTIQFTCPHCQAQFDAQLSLAMKADVLMPDTLVPEVRDADTEGGSID